MRFDVITLYPNMIEAFVGQGVLWAAEQRGLIEVHTHDVRAFARDVGGLADDRPFGGGAGMVLRPQPFTEAVHAVTREVGRRPSTVLLSAQGRLFTQELARQLARQRALTLLCGRYEGVDERVTEMCDLELSIGDYVLAGGEVAAAVVLECVARMVPGVVGRHASAATDSFYGGPLLGFPQYTRPRTFDGHRVPDVLLSGDHEKIQRWRAVQAWRKTLRNRPDLVGLALPSTDLANSVPEGEA